MLVCPMIFLKVSDRPASLQEIHRKRMPEGVSRASDSSYPRAPSHVMEELFHGIRGKRYAPSRNEQGFTCVGPMPQPVEDRPLGLSGQEYSAFLATLPLNCDALLVKADIFEAEAAHLR